MRISQTSLLKWGSQSWLQPPFRQPRSQQSPNPAKSRMQAGLPAPQIPAISLGVLSQTREEAAAAENVSYDQRRDYPC
jgi:hypothetical protein